MAALEAALEPTAVHVHSTYPRIAVIHHLQQPFLGNAAEPLGPVSEHFGTLPDLDEVDAIVSFGGEQSAWDPALRARGRADPRGRRARDPVPRRLPRRAAAGARARRRDRRAWSGGSSPGRRSSVIADDPVLGAHPARRARAALERGRHRAAAAAPSRSTQRPRGGRAEGFRVGRLAWGVQFHPEVDQRRPGRLVREWSELLEPAGVTEADTRAADARHLPGQAALSTAIFGAFARVVRDEALATRPTPDRSSGRRARRSGSARRRSATRARGGRDEAGAGRERQDPADGDARSAPSSCATPARTAATISVTRPKNIGAIVVASMTAAAQLRSRRRRRSRPTARAAAPAPARGRSSR